jgi:hypothetical protein
MKTFKQLFWLWLRTGYTSVILLTASLTTFGSLSLLFIHLSFFQIWHSILFIQNKVLQIKSNNTILLRFCLKIKIERISIGINLVSKIFHWLLKILKFCLCNIMLKTMNEIVTVSKIKCDLIKGSKLSQRSKFRKGKV